MPGIFTYSDYREYLKDACAEIRITRPFFSYRYIAQKAGLKSAGYISWVVSGKRNLSTPLVHKIAAIFKMNRREAEYFEHLVSYNQAKHAEERQHYLDRMLAFRKVRQDIVERDRCEFYSKWYYSAVRELVALLPVRNEAQIGAFLRPAIKRSEARDALELLTRLGLIRKSSKGFFMRTNAALKSGPTIDPAVIHQFQGAAMQLAQSALYSFPREERDVSTVTLSCDQKSFERIRERIAQMRAEIIEIACASKEPDQVFQVNSQVFPLSKRVYRSDT